AMFLAEIATELVSLAVQLLLSPGGAPPAMITGTAKWLGVIFSQLGMMFCSAPSKERRSAGGPFGPTGAMVIQVPRTLLPVPIGALGATYELVEQFCIPIWQLLVGCRIWHEFG